MFLMGSRITALRKQRGLTQAGLAQHSGIPQPNLSRIEREEQDPTLSTLLRICRALEVSPSDFFKKESGAAFRLTRSSVEKMARQIAGVPVRLSREEKKIADLVQDLVPIPRRRAPSAKRVYTAWQELKSRLSGEEIRTLFERVQDARSRYEKIR